MLPPLSPEFLPDQTLSRRHSLDTGLRRSRSEEIISMAEFGHDEMATGARTWSKFYEDCVLDPSRSQLSPSSSGSDPATVSRIQSTKHTESLIRAAVGESSQPNVSGNMAEGDTTRRMARGG